LTEVVPEPLCGFMIVRKRDATEDARYRDAAKDPRYMGVDRDRWGPIDERYYDSKLPEEILDDYKALRAQNDDFLGLPLTSDLTIARKLMKYCDSLGEQCEIIGVGSPLLIQHKQMSVDQSKIPNRLIPLGIDTYAIGEWSLIAAALWKKEFSDWRSQVNEYGLFTSRDTAVSFGQAYRAAAKDGLVEETADDPRLPIDILYVCAVNSTIA
jgi:hypothetical protein